MSIKSIKVILGLVAITAIGGFFLVWFGVFNVAATDKHWGITKTFLQWVRERSISSNMDKKKVPDLEDEKLIAGGAPNYSAMCVQRHLAPGMKTSEFYEGLNPRPPVFYKGETHDRDPVAAFWIIKNGIKMTGMAAWGGTHSDRQIWELIAFINAMPGMGPEAYKKMVGNGEHTHKGSAKSGDPHGEGKTALKGKSHHGMPANKEATPANQTPKVTTDHHGMPANKGATPANQTPKVTTDHHGMPVNKGATPANQTPQVTTDHHGMPVNKAVTTDSPLPVQRQNNEAPHSHGAPLNSNTGDYAPPPVNEYPPYRHSHENSHSSHF